MFEIRPYLSRFVLIPPEPWQVPKHRASTLAAETAMPELAVEEPDRDKGK
jgi:hypothetical protein